VGVDGGGLLVCRSGWKAIASSIAPSCKNFKATLLFVDDSGMRDIFDSRVLDCPLPELQND
jgi:hypothetical protein